MRPIAIQFRVDCLEMTDPIEMVVNQWMPPTYAELLMYRASILSYIRQEDITHLIPACFLQ